MTRANTGRVSRPWHRLLALVALVALVLGMVPAAEAADPAEAKVEPALLAQAQAAPDKRFRVIVQRQAARDKNERRAQKAQAKGEMAGDVETAGPDLDLIDGQAVTVRGKKVLQLARRKLVTSVALDREVVLDQIASVGSITTVATTTVASVAPASLSTWTQEANAPAVWSTYGNKGRGVTVAVLDSGINASPDLPNAAFGADLVTGRTALGDAGGHGTHVAGIIGGNGSLSAGAYMGVAPDARLLSVKVTTDQGAASYSSVIQGLAWIVANKDAYNIRVANLSLGARASTSYAQDPLNAAVEITWFRGVVVVASAGNAGPNAGTISVPGNDPFAIAVGAFDDNQTASMSDDLGVAWSSQGPTPFDNLPKPDLAASGRRVVSLRVPGSTLDLQLPDRVVSGSYFRLSGTSMAAPVVSGVAALVIAQNPALQPNQVKYILTQSAKPVAGLGANRVGAGAVDALAAVQMAAQGVSAVAANRNQTPAARAATALWPILKTMKPVWRVKGWYNGRYWADGGWDLSGFRTAAGAWNDGGWDQTAWDNFAWEDGGWDTATWADGGWDTVSSVFTWTNGGWDNGGWDNGGWDTVSRPN